MQKIIFIFSFLALTATRLMAGGGDDSLKLLQQQLKQIDSIEKKLSYKTGTIVLNNGLATANIPAGFKFIGADDAEYIITEVWGNLKGSKPLGMIVPADQMASIADYAFIVEYEEMGYVKDKDADKISYTELLADIKKDQVTANAQRKSMGLETMEIIGWASAPYYDKTKKVLHWAKEFRVEGSDENTLNYDIRVLGRRGVLNLQAVAGMASYDSVKAHVNDVLGMVSFNEGNKYSDFDSSTDKVAAWTIGGLVAGKVLAKAGLWAVIAKFAKFIIAGIALAGGAIWKFITGRRRKEEDEYVYQPQSSPESNNPEPPAAQ
jgi:uncharacterized membrane-anchored protein